MRLNKMKTKTLIFIIVFACMLSMFTNLASAEDAVSLNVNPTVQQYTSSDNSLIALMDYAKSNGGIPIKIETTTTTNWSQLILSLILSSVMILWLFGGMVSDGLENTAVKMALKQIKAKTGRNVVFIKHTNGGLFSQSMIDQDTATKLSLAMNKFKGKDFDLILHTPGGEVFSALMISRMLKNYPGKIRTIIPSMCMSGGTVLALSTDEIIMNNIACMGPTDPQLGSIFKSGSARSWNKIVKFKGKRAEDSSISMAMTGSQYTRSIRDHLEHTMDFGMTENQKKVLADYLTSGSIEHAYALTPDKLRRLGIPVKILHNTKFMEMMMKIISKTAGEGLTFV
jgi:ClpP class serine protease